MTAPDPLPTIQNEQAWRDSLKAGDEIAVKEDGRLSIHKIESVTPCKIVTKYHKFSRKTGFSFNHNVCATLHPVTPELKQSIEDAFERKRLRAVIAQALPGASADTLRAMVRAMQSVPERTAEPAEAQEPVKRFRPGR